MIHFLFSGSSILNSLWAHVIIFLYSECPVQYCSLEKTCEEEKAVKMWCPENGNCGQFLIFNRHLLYSNKNKMFGRVFSLETVLSVCWISLWWQTGEAADLKETNSIYPVFLVLHRFGTGKNFSHLIGAANMLIRPGG